MIATMIGWAVVANTPAVDLTLNAKGKWFVETGGRICVLSRYFETAADPSAPQSVVGFQPAFDGQALDVIVRTPDATDGLRHGETTATFRPSGQSSRGSFESGRMRDHATRLYTFELGDDAATHLYAGTSVTLRHDAAKDAGVSLTINYGSVNKALAALRTCQDDALRALGLTRASMTPAVKASFKNSPVRYFPSSIYPPAALASASLGKDVLALLIEADGRVGDCFAIVSAGTELDAAACKAARRMVLDPARDAAGQPMRTLIRFHVRWSGVS